MMSVGPSQEMMEPHEGDEQIQTLVLPSMSFELFFLATIMCPGGTDIVGTGLATYSQMI